MYLFRKTTVTEVYKYLYQGHIHESNEVHFLLYPAVGGGGLVPSISIVISRKIIRHIDKPFE